MIYTTSLRVVRKTFEDCNATRYIFQGLGFAFCERNILMDKGLREELKEILSSLREKKEVIMILLCVFIKGKRLLKEGF